VDDTFGDALMVEMRDLLPQDEIFQQSGTTQTRFEGVLIVRDGDALICGKHAPAGIDTYPIERPVAGIEAHLRIALADLGRGICFRKRAAADQPFPWAQNWTFLGPFSCFDLHTPSSFAVLPPH
jgi:hypothetical protein